MKKTDFFLLFYLISGVVVGSLLAAVSRDVSWLSWLAFGVDVGFGANAPALLDLAVLKVWFGFSFSLTVAHVLAISASLALYGLRKRRK